MEHVEKEVTHKFEILTQKSQTENTSNFINQTNKSSSLILNIFFQRNKYNKSPKILQIQVYKTNNLKEIEI